LDEVDIALIAEGAIEQSFAPQWQGFAVPPVGTISYVERGPCAFMWSRAVLMGESNAATMTITNLPEVLRARICHASCWLMDGGAMVHGAVVAAGDGRLRFELGVPSGQYMTLSATSFTPAGHKGLAHHWMIGLLPTRGRIHER
jgi:hypothetical protein